MITSGAIPFRTFKEKLSIINSLKDEFNHKVRIHTQDNLVLYTHISREIDGTIVT